MKKILIISLLSLMLATNANADTDGENSLSKKPVDVKDCFEKINRATFKFNMALDDVIFEPVSRAYRTLPSPIRMGTSNVLDNISNLVTIPNNILQGQFKKAGENTARLVVNSTIGLLGLFDVAEHMGLTEYEKEDYGQSLGAIGIAEGCYLVIPVLGPSTARDTIGSFANMLGGDPWYNITAKKDTHHFSEVDYWGSRGFQGVNFRAKNIDSLDNLEKNSIDFYASVRSLYLQDRQRKILNKNATIEIMYEGDWEEIETQ